MLARMRRPLIAIALTLTAGAALPATGAAATATVARVVDGDTVKVRQAGRVRTVDLLGVDAPEPGACGGRDATKALKRLLPAKARVTVARDANGPASGRYITRAGKLVNEAMIRAGNARAATGALSRGSRLTAAQDAAKQAGRGLWAACPEPAPQPQPTPDPPTGDAAKQRARTDLQGRVFTRITTTTFSSAESRLHLCSDGSFVEYVETFSDFGGSTFGTYRGRWEVIAAEYRTDFAGARVHRLNADGTEGFLDIVAQGGQVTSNGAIVSVRTSDACA